MELITKDDCQEFVVEMDVLEKRVELSLANQRPLLNGEHYLSSEEVCTFLKIGRRTLQEYRDSHQIPYIDFFGKKLYKESDLIAILEENYVPKFTYN